jgi:hypothetical protein
LCLAIQPPKTFRKKFDPISLSSASTQSKERDARAKHI